MENNKLNHDGSLLDNIVLFSEGNPGAVRVLTEAANMLGIGIFGFIINLDRIKMYGSDIWVEYKDNNSSDILKTIEAVKMKADSSL